MARFIHMRHKLKLLSHVLFIPLLYVSSQSCALDMTAKESALGRVYLEKKIENDGWRIIAWVVLDGNGKLNYNFNQHIVDDSGNNLTIKKHGVKDVQCCSKKVKLSSFFLKKEARRKQAEFELKVTHEGQELGSDALSIRFK